MYPDMYFSLCSAAFPFLCCCIFVMCSARASPCVPFLLGSCHICGYVFFTRCFFKKIFCDISVVFLFGLLFCFALWTVFGLCFSCCIAFLVCSCVFWIVFAFMICFLCFIVFSCLL